MITQQTTVQSTTHAGFKNHRIFKETESNKAAMRVLGEQKARKAERDLMQEDTNKLELLPEKSLEERIRAMSPISSASRLLSPTHASASAVYHKSDEGAAAVLYHEVTPLPPSSHLLSPTAASPKPKKQSSPLVCPPPSPPQSPPMITKVSSRLTALNQARLSGTYKKPVQPPADPREEGWDQLFNARLSVDILAAYSLDTPLDVIGQADATTRTSPSTCRKQYQHVQSRLHVPTAASRNGRWTASAPGVPCRSDPILISSCTAPTATGSLSHVSSRLSRPTVASEAGRYRKRDAPSPGASPQSHHVQASSSFCSRGGVTSRSTSAQRSRQREKFVRSCDENDMAVKDGGRGGAGSVRPSSAPPRGRTKGGKGREGGGVSTIRPITQIRREIQDIVGGMKQGQPYDATQLDKLMVELHNHPLYSKQKNERMEAWRARFRLRAQACLKEMLPFIPPHLTNLSVETPPPVQLLLQEGMDAPLAERVLGNRALWVIRLTSSTVGMTVPPSAMLHQLTSEDLGQLDIVELFAVYAALLQISPSHSGPWADCMAGLERELQQLIMLEQIGALPLHRVRCPIYATQQPVYAVEG